MSGQKAFTLIEIAIVIVIIGLLVGGVLAGQSLMRAARLNSVIAEYKNYMTSITAFNEKYQALPGDMPNATDYWGAASASNCATTASTGAATCNGDNNGQIDDSSNSQEYYRSWQHLANAGLIAGNYSGMGTLSSYYNSPVPTTLNSPASRLPHAYWQAVWVGDFNTTYPWGFLFNGSYGNVIIISGFNTVGLPTAFGGTPIMTPQEAWNIDTKMDDGMPGTGNIVMASGYGGISACTDATSPATVGAHYNLANKNNACSIVFRQAF